MKQIIVSAFCITLLFSTLSAQSVKPVIGGNARIQSLANTPFVPDGSDIVYNPAFVSQYSNSVLGDFGTGSTDNFIAVSLKLSDKFSLSLLNTNLNYNTPRYYSFSLNDAGRLKSYRELGIQSIPTLNFSRNYGLLGAWELSNSKLGIGLFYTGGFYEMERNSNGSRFSESISAYSYGINTGIIIPISTNTIIDAAISLQYFIEKYTGNKRETESQNLPIFGFYGKATSKINDKASIVSFAGFNSQAGKMKLLINAGSNFQLREYDSPKSVSYNAGIGVTYTENNFQFSGGTLVHYYRHQSDSIPGRTNNQQLFTFLIAPALFVAVEYNTYTWLTFRCGYNNTASDVKQETGNALNSQNEFWSEYEFSNGFTLGAGLTFGSFNLNLYMSPNVIRYGLGNLSGNKDTFSYMSASYNF